MNASRNIANIEIIISMNPQFSVFYFLRFHKKQFSNNTYFSCPKRMFENVDKVRKR